MTKSFLLRAPGELAGALARGRLSIFLGHLLLADIPINFRVESPASSQPLSEPKWTQSSARPFRKVFASYSHHDAQVMEAMEHHIKAPGYDYLRDVMHLRSGQAWDDRLLSKSWLSAEKAPTLGRANSSTAAPPLVLATPDAQTPMPAFLGTTPLPASPASLASATTRPTKKPSSEPKTHLEDSVAKPMPHHQ